MNAATFEAESVLRRLVAVLSQSAEALRREPASASAAELLEAIGVAEAATHRLLAELRRG